MAYFSIKTYSLSEWGSEKECLYFNNPYKSQQEKNDFYLTKSNGMTFIPS